LLRKSISSLKINFKIQKQKGALRITRDNSYSPSVIIDSDTAILQQIPLVDEFGREIGDNYKEQQREDRWKQRITSWNQVIQLLCI